MRKKIEKIKNIDYLNNQSDKTFRITLSATESYKNNGGKWSVNSVKCFHLSYNFVLNFPGKGGGQR